MKELRIKRNDPQLSEIQRGGLKAFEMLFRQYYAVLCAYGHKYVDFHDAEEIVQDSLLWIWENRENLIIESSLSSYLFKMVHHKALIKGKGFQGVVKRHGFGGVGQTTHGQHNRARKPGSIGACSYPAKVFKGMRMGGQLGGDRVTVQNLQVLKVIADHNLLLIKGSIPGCKGSIVIIEK